MYGVVRLGKNRPTLQLHIVPRLLARTPVRFARVQVFERASPIRDERPLGGRAGGEVAEGGEGGEGGEVKFLAPIAAEEGWEDGDAAADYAGAYLGGAVKVFVSGKGFICRE